MKYQLILLGPNAARYGDGLRATMESRLLDLKLDPEKDFEVLGAADAARINWKGTPVGLWYGGDDTQASDVLESLQTRGAPILPLVEDRDRFTSLVPETLRPINGRQWDDPHIPGDILRMLRLSRDDRQAFISYRRVTATPVAQALHAALNGREYQVFLDTASVEAGACFQNVLWDRLADMDLMILLDSPQALDSRWVNDELTRVNQLGLGVLQLIWPDPHRRFKGTELSEPFDLAATDFVNGDSGPDGQLTPDALGRIVAKAEDVRIRSLSARRSRVVKELLDRARGVGLGADQYPMGPVTLRRRDHNPSGGTILGIAVPLIGLPSAWTIHQLSKQLAQLLKFESSNPADLQQLDDLIQAGAVRIVYDGLGVQPDRAEHFTWLNERISLKTAFFDRCFGGAADPLANWLSVLDPGTPGGTP